MSGSPPHDPAAAPRDALDLRGLRDGGRRDIPWDLPIDPALRERDRAFIGGAWLALMRQEHLAVGAFALITHELASVGSSSVVLALVARAAADEVRHADLCRRMALRFLPAGHVAGIVSGVPDVPRHRTHARRDRALLHVVEMCCINETFTGVYLTEARARTTDVTARAAIESLLEDEIDHGRVGWAHLATACRDGWGAPVINAALPALFERAVGRIFAVHPTRPYDALAAGAHGILTGTPAREVHADALRDVILPGFEVVGIDVTQVRAIAAAHGWSA